MNWHNRNFAYAVYDEFVDFYSKPHELKEVPRISDTLPVGEVNQYGKAMSQVADYIEKFPSHYNFFNSEVPHPHQAGCLIGLAGKFAGIPMGTDVGRVAPLVFGKTDTEFYAEMCRYSDHKLSDSWMWSHKEAAKILRRIARQQTAKV